MEKTMTELKQKNDYTIGENVVYYEMNDKCEGTIVRVLYDLDPVQYMIPYETNDTYVLRPAHLLWAEDTTAQDNEDRQEEIESLMSELEDVIDALRSLSTADHPVIPFVFFGLVNGNRIDFENFLPEGEFEVKDEETDLDFGAARNLPVLVDLDLYDETDKTEDEGLSPVCAEYPDCACGEFDTALKGSEETQTQDHPGKMEQHLQDILLAALNKKK
jgi:hypothetical protein